MYNKKMTQSALNSEIITDFSLSKIKADQWHYGVPKLELYKGVLFIDGKANSLIFDDSKYYWSNSDNGIGEYGVFIPQRQGTQWRVLLKRGEQSFFCYANLGSLFPFTVQMDSGKEVSFIYEMGYGLVGDYDVPQNKIHLSQNLREEIKYSRARMITVTENDQYYLGADIQFMKKVEGIGRIQLRFNSTLQKVKVKAWKSSSALITDEPDFTGKGENQNTYAVGKMEALAKQLSSVKLSANEKENIIRRGNDLLEEEPLYVETLYSIPQHDNEGLVDRRVQEDIRDLGLAKADTFILDYLRCEAPEIKKEFEPILEDPDVLNFLKNDFMEMYMNDLWSQNPDFEYAEYVSTVDNFKNKIKYYWEGDGETGMAANIGFIRLSAFLQQVEYFANISEIKPFLEDGAYWARQLYEYATLKETLEETVAEYEMQELSKASHLDHMFLYLDSTPHIKYDKTNCFCQSGLKAGAPDATYACSFQYGLLNFLLNDTLRFNEAGDALTDENRDKLVEICKDIISRKTTLQWEKAETYLNCLFDHCSDHKEDHFACALEKTMKEIGDQEYQSVLVTTVLSFMNYDVIGDYINVVSGGKNFQNLYDGIEAMYGSGSPQYPQAILEKAPLSENYFYDFFANAACKLEYLMIIPEKNYQYNSIYKLMKYEGEMFVNKSGNRSLAVGKGAVGSPFVLCSLLSAFTSLTVFCLSDYSDMTYGEYIIILKGAAIGLAFMGVIIKAASVVIKDVAAAIPIFGVVLAIAGVLLNIVQFILSIFSTSKIEEYAKNDCVDFLKEREDPSQEWLDEHPDEDRSIWMGEFTASTECGKGSSEALLCNA